MADKENKTQTTDISNSRLGVLGDNTRVEGDIRGDDISADGRDIAVFYLKALKGRIDIARGGANQGYREPGAMPLAIPMRPVGAWGKQ